MLTFFCLSVASIFWFEWY